MELLLCFVLAVTFSAGQSAIFNKEGEVSDLQLYLDCYWRQYNQGEIPPDAVIGGHDLHNRLSYIGQALVYAEAFNQTIYAEVPFNLNPHTNKQVLGVGGPIDVISHIKLAAYGLPPGLCQWLNSDRSLFFEVEDCSSDVISINAGVSQGSVLSPTLFLLYINELLFADDSTLISCMEPGKPVSSQETVHWRQQHGLQINVDIKTIVECGLVNKVQFNVQNTQATTLTKKSHIGLPRRRNYCCSLKLLDTIQKRLNRLIGTPNLTKDLHSLEHRKILCCAYEDSVEWIRTTSQNLFLDLTNRKPVLGGQQLHLEAPVKHDLLIGRTSSVNEQIVGKVLINRVQDVIFYYVNSNSTAMLNANPYEVLVYRA
ncbi:unnamed protein product [Callosobruchus maculatus]|uniref:Reverse transcriptase domain-containing protein n=1 Tax=Callosobruchus maculatus TaxID=64391 RepID=A0A653C284_CALMS|nr:unnamed protein product [Callosobruchus maculatus]